MREHLPAGGEPLAWEPVSNYCGQEGVNDPTRVKARREYLEEVLIPRWRRMKPDECKDWVRNARKLVKDLKKKEKELWELKTYASGER